MRPQASAARSLRGGCGTEVSSEPKVSGRSFREGEQEVTGQRAALPTAAGRPWPRRSWVAGFGRPRAGRDGVSVCDRGDGERDLRRLSVQIGSVAGPGRPGGAGSRGWGLGPTPSQPGVPIWGSGGCREGCAGPQEESLDLWCRYPVPPRSFPLGHAPACPRTAPQSPCFGGLRKMQATFPPG